MQRFFGKVISGKGLGRMFGFPTLNLQFEAKPELEYGVYAGYAAAERFPALIHYGPRPTIEDEMPTFEVFFLDFPEGRVFERLEVEIIGKLREVEKFDSMEALAKQIEKDREKAVVEYFGKNSKS